MDYNEVRKATNELVTVFDAVANKSSDEVAPGGAESPFAEITDDDIDNLFAD